MLLVEYAASIDDVGSVAGHFFTGLRRCDAPYFRNAAIALRGVNATYARTSTDMISAFVRWLNLYERNVRIANLKCEAYADELEGLFRFADRHDIRSMHVTYKRSLVAPGCDFLSTLFEEARKRQLSQLTVSLANVEAKNCQRVVAATRKLHGASLGELCKRLLTHPAELAEKILVTSMYAPFDTSIDDILLPQARLRANRCALTRAALEASGDLPLTFIVTSTETVKLYTRLELEDGAIGLCMPGANIMGQAWEEVRSSGTEMLKDPFHVICTTAEKTFFEHSAAIVHVADDQLQKKRFFENNQFSGSCMAALVTLGTAERSPNEQEDLYDQLLTAVKKVNHVQIVVMPPPPIQNEAYVYQAKQLMEKFPELYKMTDSGGSLLQIGRYGGHADRRYVLGEKWNKDGILALKEYLVQVSGHTWLRNVPKANAAFPLRQMDQLHLAVAGNAPNPQPSTSARSNDSSLHTNRGGRINRSNDANLHTIRGGHINRREAPSRSGPHSAQNFDPQLLNDLLSALQPSGPPSSKFNRQQKRK
ncbi:hypothetical protein AAVH_20483 [Aphelenchoides avenae]|nr:hypothetical protein AAVH_20483 [Aphelenchus avenae]